MEGKTNSEVLYFAYGSNLSPTQMADRCPNSTPIALAHLPGWTWLINERGYANIVKNNPGSSPMGHEPENTDTSASASDPGVYGVLYRLDPEDEETLDECEGVPFAYEKRYVEATKLEGKDLVAGDTVQLLAYIDFQRVSPSSPKSEYVKRMNRGIQEAAKDWNLPETYITKVMRPFIPEPRGQ
ncbi:hypothetical protein SLS62_010332 [Diatrype stigma]|uniref:gamma-glutamylcyclotransferase n=1 Tax=Diatrype stigma TaxID=117547 RepID=A0AAN9YIF7_9PEZI